MNLDGSPPAFCVPPEGQGMRLDAALAFFLPELGLRGRRRLWDWHRITVNGHARPPGFIVSPGDLIRMEPVADETGRHSGRIGDALSARDEEQEPEKSDAVLRLVAANADFAALHKPSGLHSARIAGSRTLSLESLLAEDWKRLCSASGLPVPFSDSPPLLLTRLDAATSGIVLAATNNEAAERFRLAERQGLVLKTYFAVLRGRLRHPLEIKNKLATDKRRLTLMLDEDDPDSARHTLVTPLAAADAVLSNTAGETEDEAVLEAKIAREATLVRVRIQRGARHQIRAHAAGAGFPLAGEWLYPVPLTRGPDMRLYLHHAKVEFPGFSALDMPGWNLGETIEDV